MAPGEERPGLALLAAVAAGPELADESVRRLLETGRGAAGDDQALFALGAALGTEGVELLAVALLAGVDEDPEVAYAVAALQAPRAGGRPTLGLLATAFGPFAPAGRGVIEVLVGGVAVASGLFELLDDDGPLPERRLALPAPLFLALQGRDGPFPRLEVSGVQDDGAVPLGPALEVEVARQALGLQGEGALVVRSGSTAEAAAVARALARTLGLRAAFVAGDSAPPGLAPFLVLRGLLPVFTCALGPGEHRRLPALPGYRGPLVVLAGPDGTVDGAAGAAPEWHVPVPLPSERALLWSLAVGDAALAGTLAAQHRQGPGRIAYLGRMAGRLAALDGDPAPELRHVRAAAWNVEGGGLGGLAQPMREEVPEGALVTSPIVRRELEHLLLRCRFREGLPEQLGPALRGRVRAGVRALFVGPSGTGKTLAASWMTTRLGVPLYRIDLASVTSKYIGETEKNLAALLARAEQADVALLFDEADSLFGKRTEVKDAHDRYANAQTNYLLQRIESYDGLVLLTSNSRARFDSAFTRRLDAIIEFALPTPDERRALWRAHLGEAHTLPPESLNRLAAAADLAGGHIRNAVLGAAVLASNQCRAISYEDVVQALASEYRKLGTMLPRELGPEPAASS